MISSHYLQCFAITLATLWNSSLLYPGRSAQWRQMPPPYIGGDIFLDSGIKSTITTCRSNMSYCMFAYWTRGNDFNFVPGWCRCRSNEQCSYGGYQSQGSYHVFNCQRQPEDEILQYS